ncbi:unnamed protein product [Gongylonema pulchrum]|uniref:Ig-like domain-containing protein n=1 Tax=Gongylonema pulchrum TaxID=637853 RepID=A0A183CVD1_9BILA|nr:unnamed protein product [Gongylonema pulchrum]
MAPQFAEYLKQSYHIEELSSHLFKCIVYGTPTPQVRWYLNDRLITTNENVEIIAEDGIFILKIHQLDRSWNGQLVCEATNIVGTTRQRILLYIAAVETTEVSSNLAFEQQSETEALVQRTVFDSFRTTVQAVQMDETELSHISSASVTGQSPVIQLPLSSEIRVMVCFKISMKSFEAFVWTYLPGCLLLRNLRCPKWQN